MPRRTLGRTGVSVSILAMGCGSRFLAYPADQATAVLEKAVGLGINYLDTAMDYGQGESETRVGRFLAARRRDVFLATKVPQGARTRDAALREVEASLKRLQTDHVDLLHLHGLGDEADLAKIEAADGALKALYELREQKVARFVGMTSHANGAVMASAIERHDLDCVQMAMNPSRALRFEELALPAANRKKPRRDPDEGHGAGQAARRREGGHRLAASLRLEPADYDRRLRHAEAGVPRGERGGRAGVRVAVLARRDGGAPEAVRRAHGRDGAVLREPPSTTAPGRRRPLRPARPRCARPARAARARAARRARRGGTCRRTSGSCRASRRCAPRRRWHRGTPARCGSARSRCGR